VNWEGTAKTALWCLRFHRRNARVKFLREVTENQALPAHPPQPKSLSLPFARFGWLGRPSHAAGIGQVQTHDAASVDAS